MKKIILLVSSCVLLLMNACVQKEHAKTVTFQVDMTQEPAVKQVGLKGQFTIPSWEVTIPMTDEDGDGVYEVTLTEMTAQSSTRFKFVKGEEEMELACKPNRSLEFTYQPETIRYTAIFNVENGIQKTLN